MRTRKKAETVAEEMAPEYDFSSMGRPVRGKYFERLKGGSNLVLLDPEISKAFPTSESVNEALRSLLDLARRVDERPSKRAPRRSRSTK